MPKSDSPAPAVTMATIGTSCFIASLANPLRPASQTTLRSRQDLAASMSPPG